MKASKYLVILGILLTAFSCELLDDIDSLSIAERLEGRWQVEEDPIDFKDAYEVYIDIYEVDSNTIVIDNFLDLQAGSVTANISGLTLTIPIQELSGGYTVYGTGIISNNYNTITWNYYVDEGSGSWHESNPVYTKADY